MDRLAVERAGIERSWLLLCVRRSLVGRSTVISVYGAVAKEGGLLLPTVLSAYFIDAELGSLPLLHVLLQSILVTLLDVEVVE